MPFSINHKKFRSNFCGRAMRLGIVSDLIAHAGGKHKFSSILQFRVQFSFEAQQNMALAAPMISKIARRIFNLAHPKTSESFCLPISKTRIAFVFSPFNCRPVSHPKGQIINFHTVSPLNGTTPITAGKKQTGKKPILFWRSVRLPDCRVEEETGEQCGSRNHPVPTLNETELFGSAPTHWKCAMGAESTALFSTSLLIPTAEARIKWRLFSSEC